MLSSLNHRENEICEIVLVFEKTTPIWSPVISQKQRLTIVVFRALYMICKCLQKKKDATFTISIAEASKSDSPVH